MPSRRSSSKSQTLAAPGKTLARWCVIHFKMMLSATEKTLLPAMDASVAELTARSPQLGTVLNCFGVMRLRTKMRIVCISTARQADAETSRNLSLSSYRAIQCCSLSPSTMDHSPDCTLAILSLKSLW